MAKGAYIGVNGVARKIKKGYIGVDGIARKIKKAYIGDENGIARLFYQDGIDISAATATPADVLKGYTFYGAGSEELQTGTSTAMRVKSGNVSWTTQGGSFTISCGFKPKYICVWAIPSQANLIRLGSKCFVGFYKNGESLYYGDYITHYELAHGRYDKLFTVNSSGFTFNDLIGIGCIDPDYTSKVYYVAYG